MPATAKKYDIDFEDTTAVATKPRPTKRGAGARASSPARWNQMESLVEHFGDTAVAEPMARPRRKSRTSVPQTPQIKESPANDIIAPRRQYRYKPLGFTWPMTFLMATVLGCSVLFLVIRIGTQALSRQDVAAMQEIKLSQEAIDNHNKSIAAIQLSPETAQWAIAHGWHMANPSDIDAVQKLPESIGDAP